MEEAPNPRVLWLLISDGKNSWVFEFPQHSPKIVTVGSSAECPVRVEGLPPVAFYLERTGPTFLLVCGYPLDLRVNAKRVGDSEIILDKGIVEFGRFRFVLHVFDQLPQNVNQDCGSRSTPSAHDVDTRIVPALGVDKGNSSPTQNESVLELTESDLESTQVMGSMPDVDIWGPTCAPSLESLSFAIPTCDTLPEGVPLSERQIPNTPTGSEPSQANYLYQGFAARTSAVARITARRRSHRAPPISSGHNEVARRRFRGAANEAKNRRRGLALHRLGLRMQERPLWTVLASTLGALLIPLVLLGVDSCFARARQEFQLSTPQLESPREVAGRAFHLAFEAHNKEGRHIENVAFGTEGRSLGETNTSGQVHVVLRAKPGSVLPVEVTCPEGYRSPPPLQVILFPAETNLPSPTRIPVVARCDDQ